MPGHYMEGADRYLEGQRVHRGASRFLSPAPIPAMSRCSWQGCHLPSQLPADPSDRLRVQSLFHVRRLSLQRGGSEAAWEVG